MSEGVKQGAVEIDGKRYEFSVNEHYCISSEGVTQCAHWDETENACEVNKLIRPLGLCCKQSTSFFQPKPTPTQAELVKGWLEAGEYVVMQSYSGDDVGWVFYAHEDRAQLYAVYPCKVAIATHNITHVCNNNPTILHHGDALSTITWLCEQGYEVEFESRPRGKRIARCRKNIVEIFDTNGDLTLINIALGEYANITITRFYQPKPTPTLAEQVKGWLEAGEYVVETTNISDPFAVLYGDQRAWSNIGVFCNNFRDGMIPGESILHHGDALSTIEYLCREGYDVEFEYHDGKRVATPEMHPWAIDEFAVKTDGRVTGGLRSAPYNDAKITRFYRPTVETDAEKIERLLREGFTVETRTPGIGLIVTVPDGNCSHTSYYLDGTGEFCEDSLILDDETYLAHYREPEPEEVLRKMDEIVKTQIWDTFQDDKGDALLFWQKHHELELQRAYDIARWQLIESNPENNVTL